jgi:hypothetical protein
VRKLAGRGTYEENLQGGRPPDPRDGHECSDEHIAATLNRWIHERPRPSVDPHPCRRYRRTATGTSPPQKNGRCLTTLDVTEPASAASGELMREGILPARQMLFDAPRRITASDLDRSEAQDALRRRQRRRRRPMKRAHHFVSVRSGARLHFTPRRTHRVSASARRIPPPRRPRTRPRRKPTHPPRLPGRAALAPPVRGRHHEGPCGGAPPGGSPVDSVISSSKRCAVALRPRDPVNEGLDVRGRGIEAISVPGAAPAKAG